MTDKTATTPADVPDERGIAWRNWHRYEYGRDRGHRDFCRIARVNEGMYLGGGLQWTEGDRQALIEAGKPCFEFNQILPKVNAALGYQIANRMDIAFRPRNGQATDDVAGTLSKVAMQIGDNVDLHWKETQVYADGLIQQRGYFEIKVDYEDSLLGEITIDALDPMDVIPDPDAKSYDPDSWADVTVLRWMTLDEIEANYGKEARAKLEVEDPDEEDFGDDFDDEERNHFGDSSIGTSDRFGEMTVGDGCKRVRVVDRQYWRREMADCMVTDTGDIRRIDGMTEDRINTILQAGGFRIKRRIRRVRWTVTTMNHVLHDDWSPFNHFTIVPFFPFFRRGLTRGLVDNAVGPQQMLNKSLSQYLHTINTTANSGWITWAGTINNLRADELEDRGAESGLHIEMKAKASPDQMPRKIQPNQIPQGLDRIVDRSAMLLEQATGINEAMMGQRGPETSGIAIQSRQFAAQQQLSVPLDNLARTRHLLAGRMLEIIQAFYDEPRILRITETDDRGRPITQSLPVNMPFEDGSGVFNDLTLGEYDVVVTEQPMQITFENSQFVQVMEMMEKGAPIPWPFVLRYSNLAHKQEMIDAMERQAQEKPDPLLEAKVMLLRAQTLTEASKKDKTASEAVNKAVEALYSAMQAAGVVAQNPAVAPLADEMLASAGFEDKNGSPVVDSYGATAEFAPAAGSVPTNTDPLTPANPAVGVTRGIRTPETDGAMQ
jgi:hypothetical protein